MSYDDVCNISDLAAGPTAALWQRYRTPLVILTGLGIAGCALAASIDLRHLLFSYLIAYCFCLTLVLGMLFFVMLHHVTDAGWSTVVRRPAEQCLAALPLLAVALIPILLGMPRLFAWVQSAHVDRELAVKRPYLNVPFFLVRCIIYFAVWMLLARIMRRKSLAQDASGDPRLSLSMRRWSGPGFYLYAPTFTFAFIDLLMTLDYKWFSTIFGVYVWSSSVVASIALLTLLVLAFARGPLKDRVGPAHLHDLGKLLFAFSVFWAYIAFSQYFLIWYSNIPEETVWFLHRWDAYSWKVVSVLVPTGLFIVPFVVLMSALTKRKPAALVFVSAVVILTHYLDIYWLAMPALDRSRVPVNRIWIDAAALAALAGACGLVVLRAMSTAALYPARDPRLEESLALVHPHAQDVASH